MSAQTSTTSKRARRRSMCKTLKDMPSTCVSSEHLWYVKDLKAEAVKWVKEDINYCGKINNGEANVLIKRWMKRLNLTEEDLA